MPELLLNLASMATIFNHSFTHRRQRQREEDAKTWSEFNVVQLQDPMPVHFIKMGTVSWGKHYATIVHNVSVDQICEQYNDVADAFDKVKGQLGYLTETEVTTRLVNVITHFKHAIDTARPELSLLQELSGSTCRLHGTPKDAVQDAQDERERRALEVLGAVALGLGIYTLHELEEMKEDAFLRQQEVRHLAVAVEDVESAVTINSQNIVEVADAVDKIEGWMEEQQRELELIKKLVPIMLAVNSALTKLNHLVEACLLTIQQLKLHPNLIHPHVLREKVLELGEKAGFLGMDLISPLTADVLREKVSVHVDKGTLWIYLHIPLVGTLYSLYYLPAQNMFLEPGLRIKLAQINSYLAISPDNALSTVLTDADLTKCWDKGKTYVCANQVLTETQDGNGGCLPSLFLGQLAHVKTQCQYQVALSNDESLVSVRPDLLFFHTEEPVQLDELCGPPKARLKRARMVNGTMEIKVRRGCQISSPRFTYKREQPEAVLVKTEVRLNLQSEVRLLSTDQPARPKMERLKLKTVPLPDLGRLDALIQGEDRATEHSAFHTSTSVFLGIFAVVIAGLVIAMAAAKYRKEKHQKKMREDARYYYRHARCPEESEFP